MPQMAPMNWVILYILFSMVFLMFNFLNYYIFTINSSSNSIKNYLNKSINWKW